MLCIIISHKLLMPKEHTVCSYKPQVCIYNLCEDLSQLETILTRVHELPQQSHNCNYVDCEQDIRVLFF